MVTMLIADDKLQMTKQLFNNIANRNSNIQLIGIYSNGLEVLEYLKKSIPDILILDLIMPKINGIEVLKKLIKDKERYFPKLHIVVISGYIEKLYSINENKNYIYGILAKPYDIMMLMKIINNICEDINYNNIIKYIDQELSIFKFNINSDGYVYLKESIYEVIKRKKRTFELEKDIYVEVAKVNNKKNTKTIKWAIEKSINNMYINTKYEIVQKYFKFQEDRKPSTKLLIRTILDKYLDENYKND